MQKARCHRLNRLQPLVGARFQVLFHSSVRSAFHLSLTVLVLYRSLRSIQPQRMVPPDSHRISRVPRYSGYSPRKASYVYRTITVSGLSFQTIPLQILLITQVLQPHYCRNNNGLGFFPFARHYLGNHFCFLFLRVLRCFSSPGLPPLQDSISSIYWVAPFRNLRINGYLHLPTAYRSLSRLSSPLRAQASPVRPYLLSFTHTQLVSMILICVANMSKIFCFRLQLIADGLQLVISLESNQLETIISFSKMFRLLDNRPIDISTVIISSCSLIVLFLLVYLWRISESNR